MRCPFCGTSQDRVVDSRESREGVTIRRRRECLACHRRFTTYGGDGQFLHWMANLGPWNFLIGFALMVVGLLMTMRWR